MRMIESMTARLTSPTLVGRDEERATLERVLDDAVAGAPVHVLIAGEAGVGKSRLLGAMTTSATDRGMHVLRGACAHIGDGGVPYGPIVDALRSLVRDLDAAQLDELLGPGRQELASLIPGLRSAERHDGSQGAVVESDQARLFDAVLGLLHRLAARSPIVFAVEDLHWADPATRKTLAFLIRNLRDDRILLAMTFRADELHRRHPLLPWLAELERGGRVERVVVDRLSLDDTRALVGEIRGAEADSELVELIFGRSEGNPFFVEELLAAKTHASDRMPPTLRDVLLARIGALSEPAQALIGVAAVAGRQVDHDLLDRVAGMDGPVLLAALREAVESQVLLVGEPGMGTDDYVFRHALFQEAAYEDLLPGERQRLHRSIAGALAAEVPGDGADAAGYWAELAYHWGAARDDARCLEASVRAGDASSAAFAFGDALAHRDRALELWGSVDDPDGLAGMDRIELLDRTATVAWLSGDSRRAIVLRREMVTILQADGDPVLLGRTLERLGRVLWVDGASEAALEATEAAIDTIPVEPPTEERARALAGYGQLLMLLDRWDAAKAACRQAIEIARRVGARAPEGHALNSFGLVLAIEGQCAEGTAALRDALTIAREIGDADDTGRALVNLSEAVALCGDLQAAAQIVENGIAEAGDLGVTGTYGAFVRDNGVAIAFERGEWDEAMRLAEESWSIELASSRLRRYVFAKSVPLLVARGDERARPRLQALHTMIEGRPPETQFSAPYRVAAAEAELWDGAPDAALAIVRTGLDELAASPWHWHHLRIFRVGMRAVADIAETARARRRSAAATEAIQTGEWLLASMAPALAHVRERQHGEALALSEAETATVDAEWTRARGTSTAVQWRSLAEEWSRRQNPYLEAYARWREGEASLDAGDRSAATAALRDGHVIAMRLGARPLTAALESLAARGRIDMTPVERADAPGAIGAAPATPPPDPYGLTRRERDVLPLLVQGSTNRQIADALFISENTAGVHVSNILGKLGASTRTEAATIAVRAGIVTE
jgi:DNA-binding CsgD family transcriptional regulator/tetratricopeptide (TPR) repeat protein